MQWLNDLLCRHLLMLTHLIPLHSLLLPLLIHEYILLPSLSIDLTTGSVYGNCMSLLPSLSLHLLLITIITLLTIHELTPREGLGCVRTEHCVLTLASREFRICIPFFPQHRVCE